MTIIKNKRGTWINQYALPSSDLFVSRSKQVGYVVIKYGMAPYEKLAQGEKIPWMAERMAESGAGHQNGPANAVMYANELANQALQPGCIGAVINLEEADGGWHHDAGNGTLQLIETFKKRCNLPLFASLDTRGNRPNYPYQVVCAELCDGVMPMVYPGAFGQPAEIAFASSITPLMRQKWGNKEIHPTYQTYSPPPVNVLSEVQVMNNLVSKGIIHGGNSYTLGHATPAQWNESLGFLPGISPTLPPAPDVAAALVALRKAWKAQWEAIAETGSVDEAVALANFWKQLTG